MKSSVAHRNQKKTFSGDKNFEQKSRIHLYHFLCKGKPFEDRGVQIFGELNTNGKGGTSQRTKVQEMKYFVEKKIKSKCERKEMSSK